MSGAYPDDRADDPTPALLRAAHAGDRAALDRLLREHQAALLDRVRSMMGEQARMVLESGDVLQDTLVDIVDGIVAFAPGDEERFLRWASTIAHNNLRDRLRRRRLALLGTVSGCIDTNTPSRDADRRDHDDIVQRALASMPEDQGLVIQLRDLQQMSFEAIAQRMERTANAVQLLHTRAMTTLGHLLREALGEA